MTLALIAMAAFVPMVLEAIVAASHDRALRAQGAVEPADDVYGVMRFAYPVSFVAMMGEGFIRGGPPSLILWIGIIVFVLAKGLKYWAIGTLGQRWTFRVLVPPRSNRIVRGPYRVLSHPNYVAVIAELAAVGFMTGALVAGPIATCLFEALILARIRVEERALAAALQSAHR